MVLRFYKTNYNYIIIFLLVLSIILWSSAFFVSSNVPIFSENNPILDFITPIISIPFLNIIIAFILLFIQLIILNNLVSTYDLIQQRTYVPALIYLCLMSIHPDMLQLHAGLLINLFILLILNTLFKLYENDSNYEFSYTLGFLTALASFIYPHALFVFVAIASAYVIYRIYNWRIWLTSIIGLITPYIILFSIYYFSDNLDNLKLYLVQQWEQFDFMYSVIPIKNTYLLIVIGFVILYLIYRYISYSNDKVIRVRNFSSIMIWFFIFAFVIQFTANPQPNQHLTLLFIPLSIFISTTLLSIKRIFISETLFSILLILIIWFKFR